MSDGADKSRALCIVSDCAAGGDDTGRLIRQWAKHGWRVTILDISAPDAPDHPYATVGYQRLAGLYRQTNWYVPLQSLLAYHWLRDQDFDAIIFHHGFAAAFYSCMARHLKLAFPRTAILIAAACPHALTLEREQKFPSGRHDFENDFMEKKSVAYADAVLLSDAATGAWMRQNGFSLSTVLDEGRGPQLPTEFLSRFIASPAKPSDPAFISVCIATHNRPALLRQALASLQAQTHADFETVIVDDGSADAAMEALKNELAPLFSARNWQWARQEQAGPAAARNHAAKISRGDHLLFMDDDNIACPDEIERFALAARQDYDILACILGMHPDCDLASPPAAFVPERMGDATRPVGWTAIGGNILLAAYVNVMGETNSLFRRDVFEKLGGFSNDPNAIMEDVELLTRALVAGYRIDVVPEVLMLYRRTRQSRSMTQDIFNGHLHSLKPIADMLPPELRPLLLALRNEWYQRHCSRRDG